jgi:collagen type VII alpha
LQLDQGDRYGNCEKGRSGQEGCTGEEGRTSEESGREEGRPGEEGCTGKEGRGEEGCTGEEGRGEEGCTGEEGCCEEGCACKEGGACEEGCCSQEAGREEGGCKEGSKEGGAPSARCPCGKDRTEPGCGLALPDWQQALRLDDRRLSQLPVAAGKTQPGSPGFFFGGPLITPARTHATNALRTPASHRVVRL